MKKHLNTFLAGLSTIVIASSCSKNDLQPTASGTDIETVELVSNKEADDIRLEFASVVAKALANKDVRVFLREEAKVMFDNDHDILYQLVRDKKVTNTNKTFEQILSEYSGSESKFKQSLNGLPLLTILVPDLKDFSVTKWNVDNTIPSVAVQNSNHDERSNSIVDVFNYKTGRFTLDTKTDPGQPVIVVKENERIQAVDQRSARVGEYKSKNLVKSVENLSLYFTDDAFNGKIKSNARDTPYSGIDEKVLYSRYGTAPQRDYIYYDLNPAAGINQGPRDYNYTEAITAIKFEGEAALRNATDDWSEGYLDLYLDVIYFRENEEVPSPNRKVISASLSELRDGSFMKQKTVKVGIAGWDISTHGDRWKIKVVEHDNGAVITQKISLSTTRGTNFSVNAGGGEKIKIGISFGSTNTTTITGEATISYTNADDDLGITEEINYLNPVVLRENVYGNEMPDYPGQYGATTRAYSTGSVLVSLEPVRN